jgi:hypothetical protein
MKESEYEESIEAYKETPTYQFVIKWTRKRQVRKAKKALRRVNASFRSHYYVRLPRLNGIDTVLIYLPGIYIRSIGYIVNKRCIRLTTAKRAHPR